MMLSLKLFDVFFLAVAFEISFIDASQSDYKYIQSLLAWYKINKDPENVVQEQLSWFEARAKYESEGGLLFHPDSEDELSTVIKELDVPENIHTGFADIFKAGDDKTVEGGTVCDHRAAATPTPTELGRRRAVPVVYLRGTHYDVGFDTGRIFGSLIKNFLATYENLRDFEREYKSDAGRIAYDRTLTNMKRRYPYYVKEIQGVADGAGVPFHQLFLLQMDDLIGNVNDNHIPRNDTGGCSSIGVNSPAHAILGHTEDAFAETLNHFYIMSAHITPAPEDVAAGAIEEKFASLCYAGHLPGYTMGNNVHGLVFSINTLSPLLLKPGNTPRTFITRALLAARTLDEAEKVLIDEGLGSGNGFSVNMLWTENKKRTLLNAEVAPDLKNNRSTLNIHKYDNDVLVHCNIYERLPVKEVIGPIIDSSKSRLKAIRLHSKPKIRDEVQDILSDVSGSDFQVFQDKRGSVIKTITAGIFDLDQGTWSLYIDPPNSSEPVAVLPLTFSSQLDKP